MSKVVQINPNNSYNWFYFSQSLATLLAKQNFSIEFQALMLKRMESAFNEFDFSYSMNMNLPAEHIDQVTEQVDTLAKLLQQRTTRLLISRLSFEIELAQSQGYQ
ncbi:hypothetical protein OA92_04110 [Marinomonas sp. SBI22]|uniref:hypothetical protein n=1 Tax=unclassified Marinomonas TaxID=196814 RepID=UPI0007AF956D|nr:MULTISPECIES: hypothetical protein [unclassified Marinomonas]KZM45047.1 hypothetical protein OA92_04110 [Marinomonas sp. SBI22]KZM46746.1 hypothetical protein OA91_03170 [Marinomonas sp. SBI8L]